MNLLKVSMMLRYRIIAFVTMWLICQLLTCDSVLFFIVDKRVELLYLFRSFERKSPLFIFPKKSAIKAKSDRKKFEICALATTAL